MPKEKIITATKSALFKAVENIHDDSRIYHGYGILDDCNFTRVLSKNKGIEVSKNAILEEIRTCSYDAISSMPGHTDYLVINPRFYISASSISDNQIYHTVAPVEYYHSICKYNPHLDVYIKIDHENMTISFMLGGREKTLKLEINSEYVFKLLKTKMLCSGADDLERFMKDTFSNPRFICVGRKALDLDVCECLRA